MSVGSSGRIVIEIDPQTKQNLYTCLTKNGMTLKSWFLVCTEKYLMETLAERKNNEDSAITECNEQTDK